MKKVHKCNYETCIICYEYNGNKNVYDLASYCPECGKIGTCLNNDLRIIVDACDGKQFRKIKTSEEIYNEFKDRFPIFEIRDWEQEYI